MSQLVTWENNKIHYQTIKIYEKSLKNVPLKNSIFFQQIKNPNENVVYDAIASMPIIGVDGQLEQASSLALLSLWSVFLGLLVNGTIAYFMFWA